MKIFLIGFMGSGKTTIGRHIAEKTGFFFVDTDRFIEMRHRMTVSEIFEQRGEAAFREMERDLLIKVSKFDSTVISTGGAMPCFGNNMDIMLESGKVIYLSASPEELSKRLLRSHKKRPLIRGKTEEEMRNFIEEQLEIREPFYNRANFILKSDNLSLSLPSDFLLNDISKHYD